MAKTLRQFTGDGVRTVFPVDFELGFVSREHIFVYTGENYLYKTNPLTFTWVSDKEIELDTPVSIGTVFTIRRIVPRDEAFNDYESGAILREDNLDDSFLQALMICEELEDGFFKPDEEYTFSEAFLDDRYIERTGDTMTGRLSGVNAVQDSDFMPKSQVLDTIDTKIESIIVSGADTFIDYGLVTETVGDMYDYGGI